MSTIIISEKCPVLFGYFVLVSVLARMRTCTISYEPSLHGKINAICKIGKFIKNQILFLYVHVAVSVIARMCTRTVSCAPSLLGIVVNTV